MEEFQVDKLWEASDLHLTALHWSNVLLDFDFQGCTNDGLILAGDIAVSSRLQYFTGFFEKLSERYKYVWVVMGNHDFWDADFNHASDIYKDFFKSFNNIFLMEADKPFRVNQYIVVGDTLWTDFNRGNPRSMLMWKNTMNDAVYISSEFSYRAVKAQEIYESFQYQFGLIQKTIEENSDTPILVITHHAPSEESIGAKYRGHYSNDYYYSNLSEFILDHPNIKLWVHGHMHGRFAYPVGEHTNVLCNAYGYEKEQIPGRFYLVNLFEHVL